MTLLTLSESQCSRINEIAETEGPLQMERLLEKVNAEFYDGRESLVELLYAVRKQVDNEAFREKIVPIRMPLGLSSLEKEALHTVCLEAQESGTQYTFEELAEQVIDRVNTRSVEKMTQQIRLLFVTLSGDNDECSEP